MPPLPSDGYLRLPSWVVGLPWLLLVFAVGTGRWMVSDLQRQLTEKELANAALRSRPTPGRVLPSKSAPPGTPPTASLDTSFGEHISLLNSYDNPPLKSAVRNESPAPGTGDTPPRRRIVLPTTE